MTIILALLLVIGTLIIGLPVPYCFMGATLFMVMAEGYNPSFLLPYSYSYTNAVVLLCVPLFVAVGSIMNKGGIGKVLVDFVDLFMGRIRGGLGVVGVVACAVFGSISGSCAATLSCIGSIMFPRLRENGYPMGHSAALLSSAAPLGLLIPPSASMILYAWIGRQSVLACFLATVGPGLILMTLLSILNLIMLRNNPDVVVQEPLSPGEFGKVFRKRSVNAIPALLMPFIVLGGIYGGFFTPTEAAAVAVLYSIPVGFFVYKSLTVKDFYRAMVDTASTTGVVMVMMFCIVLLSRIYVMEDLPGMITAILERVSDNKNVILLVINVMLIIMGMIMDDTSAMLLSTPILLPVVQSFGVHPIHFGAIIGVNLGLGLITPPTAPTLYFGGRIANTPVSQMMKPTLIFIAFAWLPTLFAVSYFPSVSLWLPRLILGGRF